MNYTKGTTEKQRRIHMKNNNFILLMGESGSGKTAIAEEMENRYGLTQVISYTTRMKRNPDESNHIFLTDDEFDNLEDLVAYTEFDEQRYGATAEQIEENFLYVIDPNGIDYFTEIYCGTKNPIVVYVETTLTTRFNRMCQRDEFSKAKQRLENDKEAFREAKQMADYIVSNENNLDEAVQEIYKIWKGTR